MIGFADGGCRRNPGGPGSYGWVVEEEDGRRVACGSSVIPSGATVTVNTAEYQALVMLLRRGRRNGIPLAEARMDSQLVVHEVRDAWKTKAPHLRELRDEARAWLGSTPLVWTQRGQNDGTDALAREARRVWEREVSGESVAEVAS